MDECCVLVLAVVLDSKNKRKRCTGKTRPVATPSLSLYGGINNARGSCADICICARHERATSSRAPRVRPCIVSGGDWNVCEWFPLSRDRFVGDSLMKPFFL